MFLSPLIPWKSCFFHQLVSPLKIILFYAPHSETRVSVKIDTGAALCPAPSQSVEGFSGQQLVEHSQQTPFFGEQLSHLTLLSSGIDLDLRQLHFTLLLTHVAIVIISLSVKYLWSVPLYVLCVAVSWR